MKQKYHNSNLKVYRNEIPNYPNAADNRYVTEKILNIIAAIVSGVGLMTAMVVLITLT